jgi:hypothetical protein
MNTVVCIKFDNGSGWTTLTLWPLKHLRDAWAQKNDLFDHYKDDIFKLEIETGEGRKHVGVFNGADSLRRHIEGMVENFPSTKSASKR